MTRYIGVDLHTNSFTVCILQAGKEDIVQTFPLQNGGMEKFSSALRKSDQVALEATGNSAWFCRTVEAQVKRVVIIAPWQFEVIRRSVKKTDRHDARAIAFFLSKDMLPEARQKNEDQIQLASLISTRDQLVKLRVSLLGKVHGMFVRHGMKVKREALTSKKGFERHVSECDWSVLEKAELEVIASQLDALRQNVKRLEKEIGNFARTLPGYENLVSIKGIGPLSAAVMLTHIGDIADFKDTGKLAAYFGITPRVSQSNAHCSVGRITKRGNKIARTTLVQCTLIAKRYSRYFHDFYERIKAKRGTGKAIIATARKLLNTIFHTLKKQHGIGSGKDIGVAISVAQPVEVQARQYIAKHLPGLGQFLTFAFPDGTGHQTVAGGGQAAALSEQVASVIRQAKQDNPDTMVHVFAAVPTSLMFYLGQHHQSIAPCIVYEFDFDRRGNKTYQPSFVID